MKRKFPLGGGVINLDLYLEDYLELNPKERSLAPQMLLKTVTKGLHFMRRIRRIYTNLYKINQRLESKDLVSRIVQGKMKGFTFKVWPVEETGYENLLLVRMLVEIKIPSLRMSSVADGLTIEGILENWSGIKPVALARME